jgi:hypothetical protein
MLLEWWALQDSNLSRLAGVSGAGARWRNPERSEGHGTDKLVNGGHCRTRTCDLVRVNYRRTANQQLARSEINCDEVLQKPRPASLSGNVETLGSTP